MWCIYETDASGWALFVLMSSGIFFLMMSSCICKCWRSHFSTRSWRNWTLLDFQIHDVCDCQLKSLQLKENYFKFSAHLPKNFLYHRSSIKCSSKCFRLNLSSSPNEHSIGRNSFEVLLRYQVHMVMDRRTTGNLMPLFLCLKSISPHFQNFFMQKSPRFRVSAEAEHYDADCESRRLLCVSLMAAGCNRGRVTRPGDAP